MRAKKLDEKELVSFKELLRVKLYNTETLFKICKRKGIITKQEFLKEIEAIQKKLPR